MRPTPGGIFHGTKGHKFGPVGAISVKDAREHFRKVIALTIEQITLSKALGGEAWSTADLEILTAEWLGAKAQAIRRINKRKVRHGKNHR